MNYRQLKQDARDAISTTTPSPHQVTCLFWLCILVVIVVGELATYNIESTAASVTGIAAIASRNSSTMLLMVVTYGTQLLSTVWSAAYTNYALALSRRDENPDFHTIVQGFRRFFSILLLFILEYVRVMLWSMLFVIPGIIAMYRYRFSLQILLENPTISPSEAIARSCQMTHGHKMQIFILDLHLLWYQLLASVGSVIFLLYTMQYLPIAATTQNTYVLLAITYLFSMLVDILFLPYYHTTIANAYHWVKEQRQQVQ